MIEITIDKEKIKKKIFVLAAVLAVIAVLVLAGNVISGYKTIVKESINAINRQKTDKLSYDKYSLFDSQYNLIEFMKGADSEGMDKYADYIEELKVLYGSKYKITYDIGEKAELGEEELSNIQEDISKTEEELAAYEASIKEYCERENLEENEKKKILRLCSKVVADYKQIKVSKGYKISLDCKIAGSLNFKEFTVDDILMVNINGEWIFISYSDNQEGGSYYPVNTLNPEFIYAKVKNWY